MIINYVTEQNDSDTDVIIQDMECAAKTTSSVVSCLSCPVQNGGMKLNQEAICTVENNNNNNTISPTVSNDEKLNLSDNKEDEIGMVKTKDPTLLSTDYEVPETDEVTSNSSESHSEKIDEREDNASDYDNDVADEDVKDFINNSRKNENHTTDDFVIKKKQNINLLLQESDHSLSTVNENKNLNLANKYLKINAREHLSLSDLETPVLADVFSNNLAQTTIPSNNNINNNGSNNNINNIGDEKDVRLKSKLAIRSVVHL